MGAIDRKATHSSSRCTNRPGSSPSMMRVKIVGIVRSSRTPDGRWGWTLGSELVRATEGQQTSDRILTIPNVITLVRLLCLPVFLWLLFHEENRAAAAWLLGFLGATDFVDGYVARHFHQTSELGKILDTVADGPLSFVGIGGILIDGSVPVWFAWAVLIREVLVTAAT